jgi:hypothetical protein
MSDKPPWLTEERTETIASSAGISLKIDGEGDAYVEHEESGQTVWFLVDEIEEWLQSDRAFE